MNILAIFTIILNNAKKDRNYDKRKFNSNVTMFVHKSMFMSIIFKHNMKCPKEILINDCIPHHR